jgi:CCR4-NOT transcription complex subunit 10
LKLIPSDDTAQNSSKRNDAQYYNNLACIYLTQKRFHAARLFSQKAVDLATQKALSDEILPTDFSETTEKIPFNGCLSYRCTAEVLYNAAVAMLTSGNPFGAFLYFEQTVPSFGSRPLLWIRMAECCLHYHTMEQKKEEHGELLLLRGPYGRDRRLLLNTSQSNEAYGAKDNPTAKSDRCTMHRAVQYLTNALSLIRSSQKSISPAISVENEEENITEVIPEDSDKNSKLSSAQQSLDTLECCALLKLAYVYLVLNSALWALSAAKEILSLPRLTQAGKQTR